MDNSKHSQVIDILSFQKCSKGPYSLYFLQNVKSTYAFVLAHLSPNFYDKNKNVQVVNYLMR